MDPAPERPLESSKITRWHRKVEDDERDSDSPEPAGEEPQVAADAADAASAGPSTRRLAGNPFFSEEAPAAGEADGPASSGSRRSTLRLDGNPYLAATGALDTTQWSQCDPAPSDPSETRIDTPVSYADGLGGAPLDPSSTRLDGPAPSLSGTDGLDPNSTRIDTPLASLDDDLSADPNQTRIDAPAQYAVDLARTPAPDPNATRFEAPIAGYVEDPSSGGVVDLLRTRMPTDDPSAGAEGPLGIAERLDLDTPVPDERATRWETPAATEEGLEEEE